MSRAAETEVVGGRYRISARVASGGMGEVYRAWDPNLRRTVALKVLPLDRADRPEVVERFRAEAQAAARLSHTNVVQVHDWGETDTTCYMVMEYVRGRNLREILAANGPIPPRQACEVMIGLLEALEAAHARGLVHRDIKPENVMVTVDGKVKVADFGIARAVEDTRVTGGLFGTVAYVAPEQARGQTVDGRTDIYSAGCVLYEMLTGVRPFEGDAAAVLHQHLNARVPPPSEDSPAAGQELDAAVARATEPEQARRFESAQEMRIALEQALPTLPEAPPLAELCRDLTSEVSSQALETAVPTEPRKRLRWWHVPVALLIVALAVTAYALRPVRMPELRGFDLASAQNELSRAGIEWEVEHQVSQAPLGAVLDTSPDAGSLVWPWRQAGIRVSAGPALASLPEVTGLLLPEATAQIEAAGLQVGDVLRRHDPAPPETVLEQDPRPGRVVRATPVNLVVSQGPELTRVPEVTGKYYEEAVAELERAGLGADREEVFHEAEPEVVVDQQPAAGREVAKGSRVRLIVSKGPEPFAMPDVREKACAEAKAELEALGLVVNVQARSGGCGSNRVLDQDPFPGAQVRRGQEATLFAA